MGEPRARPRSSFDAFLTFAAAFASAVRRCRGPFSRGVGQEALPWPHGRGISDSEEALQVQTGLWPAPGAFSLLPTSPSLARGRKLQHRRAPHSRAHAFLLLLSQSNVPAAKTFPTRFACAPSAASVRWARPTPAPSTSAQCQRTASSTWPRSSGRTLLPPWACAAPCTRPAA